MADVVLLEQLNLRNGRRSNMLQLLDALDGPPEMVLTMDGACTLTLTVADAERKLTRSPLITERSFSRVAGVPFDLAAVAKAGDRVTLTYEDGITAALRRRDKRLVVPAGSMTRRDIASKLAREANVPHVLDPTKRRKVSSAVDRGGKDGDENSWELLGSLAEEVKLRRFSTGQALIFGSDEWLLERGKPVRMSENTGAVGNIDFDLDTGKRASTARVDVDAATWALPPGTAVVLGEDMGPAEGKWLVQEFRRPLTSTRAAVTLTRGRHALKEPKRAPQGEAGVPDHIPGLTGSGDTGGSSASPARERMVAFALAQNGDAYVWGGKGPSGWDCSGLVQGATAAAGNMLPAPSASQAARVADAGKGMSIEAAIGTRGALLFRMGSPYNHVAISLGNGQTIEAMGTAYGVCIGNAGGRGWTSAGWWI